MLLGRAAAVAVALAGTVVVHAPGAQAAEPVITLTASPSFAQPMEEEIVAGSGILAGAICEAVAQGGTPTQVAVTVEVTCTMNGTTVRGGAPGPVAATSILVATAHPIDICVTGTAAFLEMEPNASDIRVVTAGPVCRRLPWSGNS